MIWKAINDLPEYKVSSTGQVMNKNGKVLSLSKNKGYNKINLFKDKRSKSYQVHRLVAEAFISNPSNKPNVNHINGIKDDNRVENLEWCTVAENTHHYLETTFKKRVLVVKDCLGNLLQEIDLTGKTYVVVNERF